MSRQRQREAGVGLIDSMIAISMLVIGLLATVVAALSGERLARSDAETRAATQAAAQLLDEVRAAPFDTLAATYDGTTHPVESLVQGVPSGVARIEVAEEPTGFSRWPVLRVVVRVEIVGVNGRRTLEFGTYVIERDVEGLPF